MQRNGKQNEFCQIFLFILLLREKFCPNLRNDIDSLQEKMFLHGFKKKHFMEIFGMVSKIQIGCFTNFISLQEKNNKPKFG